MAAHGKDSKQFFQCDHCGDEMSLRRIRRHLLSSWLRKELCVGCIHSCLICDQEFYPEHTVQTIVPNQVHSAEHVCVTCYDKRNSAQEAAWCHLTGFQNWLNVNFDLPPVSRQLYICWHPEADDSFDVSGCGQTCNDAYIEMLEDFFEAICDEFETDQEATEFLEDIERRRQVCSN